jgi:homoserine O-acetyltransferase
MAAHVTGAWRDGDPVGWRRFADVGSVVLEFGGALPDVQVAYETWGELSPRRDNAVLVLHALTGDAHAAGPAGPGQPTPGWWNGIIGPGLPIDTDRCFVVSANVLGGCQGTTGPASLAPDGRPWGSRWPRITVRDQVAVEHRLAAVLGIDRYAAVVGGSMGGMRALEWLLMHPESVGSAVVMATSAYATADQIGTQTAQVHAIANDPHWYGGDYYDKPVGPKVGLGLARRFAHLTYRTDGELDVRFGRQAQTGEDPLRPCVPGRHVGAGRFAVQSYLDHHADKLHARFDAGTYVALTDAMSSHDVGRGRGGVAAALARVQVPVEVVGIDSDRLYPIRLQAELADLIPTAGPLREIASPFGHDGFLLESQEVGAILARALDRALVTGEDPSTSTFIPTGAG